MFIMLWFTRLSQWLLLKLKSLWFILRQNPSLPHYGRQKKQPHQNADDETQPIYCRTIPKPDWVKHEIIRLKALMPNTGCRQLADCFNRRFGKTRQMTVGKTYVSYTIQKHQYEIQILRKKMKHKRPKPVPKNLVWGMDLTGKTDTQGKLHNILGILEHHSRATMTLTAVKDKTTITLLHHLLNAVEHYGKPKMIRTDNEAVFISRLFKLVLWLLGIRHQRIDLHCPWQNGRIERFFGTLKEKLNSWDVDSREQLNYALRQFRFWYHHVRPHQYLDGRTPAEVWQGKDIYCQQYKREYWFEAWDGLLQGYYLRI